MKKMELNKGKKLNKKELKSIQGGMLNCMEAILCTEFPCEAYPPGDIRNCTTISPGCAQKICRP
ncbi:bacteriocin [Chryseobacterium sp. Marseille-Q8038]